MHFEIPKVPLRSIKEFAAHYLMIVLGILTALGLEQWVESRHHAHAAETARRAMEIELRANLADVRAARQRNGELLERLAAFSAGVGEELKAGRSRAEIAGRIAARSGDAKRVGYSVPSLRHEAWDVAVANQSVAHIDPTVLRRLSAAYAVQRETEAATRVSLGLFSGPRLADAMTDLDIGAIDPLEFLHVMRQVVIAVRTLQEAMTELEAALRKAVPGEAAAGPPPEPAPEEHG